MRLLFLLDVFTNSFSGETLVMTTRGLRPISELIAGDLVLAWDEATGKTGYFVITDTISHVDPEIVLLTLDSETLKTTAEHPFYVVETSEWLPLSWGGRWVDAGKLQVGDDVRQADGTTGEVRSVRVVADSQRMYNLTVDQAYTFFVGQGQWLVHKTKTRGDGTSRRLFSLSRRVATFATTRIRAGSPKPLDQRLCQSVQLRCCWTDAKIRSDQQQPDL